MATTETREFQAEVKQLLDIVINSLYTERDIFLRELISNAADALEKFRHQQLIEDEVFDPEASLEINISVNEDENTLTISDSGIGMTRAELESQLGTIAHSGSKNFLERLQEGGEDKLNLIGQFGVGFYAAFMVADRVRVLSRSYKPDADGCEWSSDGSGSYTLAPAEGLHRGTKVILELKEDAKDYAKEETIKRIIKEYSNFVSFPIKVTGETVNTVQALWARDKKEISEEEYTEFYKFIANAFDEPLSHLHFSTDAPLTIKALLFIPSENMEGMGFGRMNPGVSLYCKRVLIEQNSKNILPDWLRFVKGVVDSEDLPLNISRQSLQDNTLVARLRQIITKRLLKFWEEQAKKEPEKYEQFWRTFGIFLKEGATTDYTNQEKIAGLLRFESSKSEPGQLISLSDYVERMQEGQNEIYYINGPNREAIEKGPYLEAFRKKGVEVIYTMEPIDDFVFNHLGEFDSKKLVSADSSDLELPETEETEEEKAEEKLDQPVADSLTKWMKEVLDGKVKDVTASSRLESSPAMIVNPDGMFTSSMERVMHATREHYPISAKNLEINTGHSLIKGLADLRARDEEFARSVVEQIYDNAMVQAGLLVEPRDMVDRTYKILERAISS
ncbi:MAG: molecular chaperone HtpG [Desulfurivibrionaceae bacterium]